MCSSGKVRFFYVRTEQALVRVDERRDKVGFGCETATKAISAPGPLPARYASYVVSRGFAGHATSRQAEVSWKLTHLHVLR